MNTLVQVSIEAKGVGPHRSLNCKGSRSVQLMLEMKLYSSERAVLALSNEVISLDPYKCNSLTQYTERFETKP